MKVLGWESHAPAGRERSGGDGEVRRLGSGREAGRHKVKRGVTSGVEEGSKTSKDFGAYTCIFPRVVHTL